MQLLGTKTIAVCYLAKLTLPYNNVTTIILSCTTSSSRFVCIL